MPTPRKTCNKCGDTKPLDEYHKNKRHKDGHEYHCKQCRREAHQANREKINEQQRAYREANREKINERNRTYREANREKIREFHRAHYAANREEINERNRTYHHENRDFLNRYSAQREKEMNDLTRLAATRSGQPWEQWEDDFITNHPEMTVYQLATHLGRTYASIQQRKTVLRGKGTLA